MNNSSVYFNRDLKTISFKGNQKEIKFPSDIRFDPTTEYKATFRIDINLESNSCTDVIEMTFGNFSMEKEKFYNFECMEENQRFE
jgi:hypothetical protein